MKLRDRVVLITGGAQGLGLAMAQVFAQRGCQIALVDVHTEALRAAQASLSRLQVRVSTHLVDVSDAAAVEALPAAVLEAHGALDVVVNNAGVTYAGRFHQQSLEDWEWLLGVNLWGTIHVSRACLPLLLKQGSGHLVNISSICGLLGIPDQVAYCTSKFAIRGFTESLAHELVGTGVGWTLVHPGAVATGIASAARAADEGLRARFLDFFERDGKPPLEVAEAIVRAVERKKVRLLYPPEIRLMDGMKSMLPVITDWLIHQILKRAEQRALSDSEERGEPPPGRAGSTAADRPGSASSEPKDRPAS